MADDWGNGAGDTWGKPPEEGEAPIWNAGKENDGNDASHAWEDKGRGAACRNCGREGHFARECPQPRKGGGPCFNCGEEGHTKAECTKPRVFKGTCRICNQEGHPAAECPEKPPEVCRNCQKEGHKTIDCKENRKFDLNAIPDKTSAEAWASLRKADKERELTDFREALQVYSKAEPEKTFVDIETRLRAEQANVYLIALEKEVGDTRTLINLQGKLDCKYMVAFYFKPKPQRASLKDRWPASPEENLERLADAGFPYDRQIPKCDNCGEMGHVSKHCKSERIVIDRVEIKCVHCGGTGHRARDCPEPRADKSSCRNCGASDHKAAGCTEPRKMDNIECRRCNKTGHMAKDCPKGGFSKACRNCGSEGHKAYECDQPKNMDTVQCRNCDEMGHFSRDCPQQKDWSRVKCNNCGETGHPAKRCPKPVDALPDPDVKMIDDSGWGASNDGRVIEESANNWGGGAADEYDGW